jgi:hypothetical protein
MKSENKEFIDWTKSTGPKGIAARVAADDSAAV